MATQHERILEAIDAGARTSNEISQKTKLNLSQVHPVVSQLKRMGVIVKTEHGFTRATGTSDAGAPEPASAAPDDDRTVCFAEDGDLQLWDRDGEGSAVCVPNCELARLVDFVEKHFPDALRGRS